MKQVARIVTMEGWGFLAEVKYLLHDWNAKYYPAFLAVLKDAGVNPLALPARSPRCSPITRYRTVSSGLRRW